MRLSFAAFAVIVATSPALAALPGAGKSAPAASFDSASLNVPAIEAEDGLEQVLVDSLVMAIEGGKSSFGLGEPAAASDAAIRLSALKDFRAYVETVIAGLSRADAETNMVASVAEQLTDLSATYDAYVFAELRAILDPTLLGVDGWFNRSRFGTEVEAMAGELVAGTANDGAFLRALSAQLRRLEARGEASRQSVDLIDARLAEIEAQIGSRRGAHLAP